MKIMDNPRFDIEDFKYRWMLARISCFNEILNPDDCSVQSLTASQLANYENRLISRAVVELNNELQDILLRKIFDYSRKLAISLSKFLKLSWHNSDFVAVLPNLGIDCFSGIWDKHNESFVLKRSGCSINKNCSPFVCNYFRESLDGLVMGLGEDERFVRQKSLGSGDHECLDVLFLEPNHITVNIENTNNSISFSEFRFAEIDPLIQKNLDVLKEKILKMGGIITFYGVNENTIYYSIQSAKSNDCSSAASILKNYYLSKANEILPGFKHSDRSPVSVMEQV